MENKTKKEKDSLSKPVTGQSVYHRKAINRLNNEKLKKGKKNNDIIFLIDKTILIKTKQNKIKEVKVIAISPSNKFIKINCDLNIFNFNNNTWVKYKKLNIIEILEDKNVYNKNVEEAIEILTQK